MRISARLASTPDCSGRVLQLHAEFVEHAAVVDAARFDQEGQHARAECARAPRPCVTSAGGGSPASCGRQLQVRRRARVVAVGDVVDALRRRRSIAATMAGDEVVDVDAVARARVLLRAGPARAAAAARAAGGAVRRCPARAGSRNARRAPRTRPGDRAFGRDPSARAVVAPARPALDSSTERAARVAVDAGRADVDEDRRAWRRRSRRGTLASRGSVVPLLGRWRQVDDGRAWSAAAASAAAVRDRRRRRDRRAASRMPAALQRRLAPARAHERAAAARRRDSRRASREPT